MTTDLHRGAIISAWLVRLWEIAVPDGVVVIVSTKGYGAVALKPDIGSRLVLAEERELPFTEPTGKVAVATVTIWHRN